jgi:F-type H+-transporting ATPase subunit a
MRARTLAALLLITLAPATALLAQDPAATAPQVTDTTIPAVSSAQPLSAADAARQNPAGEPAAPLIAETGAADIIMPHITDSRTIEFPAWKGWGSWAGYVTLPKLLVPIGGGRTFDVTITKHVVFMMIAAILTMILLIGTARAHAKHTHEIGRPRGRAAALEAVILYLRDEIYLPVMGGKGHGGERYIPFVLTLFFFIAFCNLLGLIPYGATATGNLGVTLSLALITFVVVEVAGMKALGAGYINTVVYWPHGMPIYMKLPLTLVLTPVELIGKFTKPFALTIRLFANMVAGHVIILALIGLIFTFGIFWSPGPLLMAFGIMLLEIMVSFLQAFIFSLLAAVFIGQIRAAHH